MELGLLCSARTCKRDKRSLDIFLLERLVLLSLWSVFCRCCHDQVPVADKCNFSFGAWREGETTKTEANIQASLQSRGKQTTCWNSPPLIKDSDLHSDLPEEQSRSTPCSDSLFCVEEMKTQRVQGQEITSIAALKNCSGLFTPRNHSGFTPWKGGMQRAFSSQFIKIYKEGFALSVYCATFLKTIGISALWVLAFSNLLEIFLGLSDNYLLYLKPKDEVETLTKTFGKTPHTSAYPQWSRLEHAGDF